MPSFYEVVRRFPAGRVTTDGTVDTVLPGRTRHIGYARAALPSEGVIFDAKGRVDLGRRTLVAP